MKVSTLAHSSDLMFVKIVREDRAGKKAHFNLCVLQVRAHVTK